MNEMMLMKLLAITLLLIHIWLLNTAQSDHVRRYKQTLARRADSERAAQGREQCGSVSHKRPWRSLTQHYPLAGSHGRHARLRDLSQRVKETRKPSSGQSSSGSGNDSLGISYWDFREKKSAGGTLQRIPVRNKEGTLKKTHEDQDSPYTGSLAQSRGQGVLDRDLSSKMWTGSSETSARPSGRPGQTSLPSERPSLRRFPRSNAWLHGAIEEEEEEEDEDFISLTDGAAPRQGLYAAVAHGDHSVQREDSSGEQEERFRNAAGDRWGGGVPEPPPQWMTALYFSGQREQLRVKPSAEVELPRASFTIELWVRAEGGQSDPAVIAGVFDNCSHPHSDKGWSVGIRTTDPTGRKDARFFFALRTDRAPKATTIMAHWRYQPSVWTHVAASYDGRRMALYVDGARAGEMQQQSGDLCGRFISRCRLFLLGGDLSEPGNSFRGQVGGVILWGHARTHEELARSPDPRIGGERRPLLAQWADFSHAEHLWMPYRERQHPGVVAFPAPEPQPLSPFLPPPCGLTVCDNTDVILSYNRHWPLRAEKRLRYRVVNLCEDDGGQPTVTEKQVQQQHRALERAFRRYNLTLELSVLNVRNSSLRHRLILSNCHLAKVGNRHCDPECDHPLTGRDGGDCLRLGPCYSWKRRDGVCDPECNSIRYDYDDGDCCDPDVTDVFKTCFDPESPDRAYLSVRELKDLLHLSSADTLNVFFANNSAREELAGAATWPWAKEALTHQGGMILNPSYFGTTGHNNTMIHEMGHIFGLYHVFKGVSERESCDDPCQETTASMDTGDFCADTAPTPKSKACRDPDPVNDTCGLTHYRNTPYNNYMSYTDDNCTNHFTPNQVARMHCYVDLVYKNWIRGRRPTPVALAPVVIGQDAESLSIHWLPPVSGPLNPKEDGVNCQQCDEDGVLHQYALEASSPHACDTSGYWTPEEAVGAPDVYQPCEPSMQAWSPEVSLYEANMSSPCPQPEGCVLLLRFLHAVVPESLTVWVTYISCNFQAISDIEFILVTGQSLHSGPQHVFCDVPLTLRVQTRSKVNAVKISTFDKKMEIDAVLLTSQANNQLCSSCERLLYSVHREPAFGAGQTLPLLNQPSFTDRDVEVGRRYEYRVQVEAGGAVSELSPPLVYTHAQRYCGDGLMHGVEECDDGNLLDGDGCSKKCLRERGYNCNGEPSLCYAFEGDGVCEEFERGVSVLDCGFFTPQGYFDQWASSASASHQDLNCPALTVIGEPKLTQECRPQFLDVSEALEQGAWVPCAAQTLLSTYQQEESPVWLKVGFDRPGVAASIIIYLASDGSWHGDHCRKMVTVQLCDTTGRKHTLGTYELSCRRNPLVVNVTHNLSQPFFLTAAVQLNFSSAGVGVRAVAMRTSCPFSNLALTGCARGPCTVDVCSPPQVNHASVTCSSPRSASSHCTVLCHRGYSLSILSGQGFPLPQREAVLRCVNGAWDRRVLCQPLDCGFPDESLVFSASFSCPDGTSLRQRCFFSCNAPAILQGESATLECMEDGLWSSPEAYCKIECPDPPLVPNATLLLPQTAPGGGHEVGSICRYRCHPGHYVIGSLHKKPRKRFLKLQCLEGGRWEEGGCAAVSCPVPPSMFEGMYACTSGLAFGSICTLHCPDPKERHSIRCTKDGRWTGDFTMCERIVGSCPLPPELNQVEYVCEEGHHVGAVCYPACIVALSDPVVLGNASSADMVKHWMLPSKVERVVCTGRLKWHPSPETIHCIQSCEPFGGDGWCDTINNRAYCQYDGGDCCPSTLSTGKVIQFGVDCDHDECTCRDPEAEENRGKAKEP